MIEVQHQYQPTQPDGPHADMLQPSHWKAPHQVVITYPLVLGTENDNITIQDTGQVRAHGAGVTFDDVYPSSLSVGLGANAPAFSVYHGNMKAYEFPAIGPLKELDAAFQIYHSYDEGTAVGLHIHLYIPDNAAGGVIKFGCEYHWDNVWDTGAPVTQTVYGTVTRAPNEGISKNHILSFGALSGTGKEISSILSARIFRSPADATDTFEASVWLRSGDAHISKNSSGSQEEYVK